MVDEDAGLITVYYGADIKDEEALGLKESLEKGFPDLEIDLHNGGQPVYYYIVSVE